jgi:REP element-mobilizing transposase RayT
LSRILVHLIFSTKDRVPCLDPAVQAELHPYLAVVLRDNGCPSLKVGGAGDHVHLLFGLSRTMSIAEVVETVKTSSSKWIKGQGPQLLGFHWQGGYGAFSVSQSHADTVVQYIAGQVEHHRRVTFQEEFRAFLERYQVPFDERYVWD